MKRILVFFSPVVFLIFTACGGADTPPPAASCANPESLKNLDCLSSIAEKVCCNEQAAVMNSYASYCQAATSRSPGGYGLPVPPTPPAPTPQVPPTIPGCSPSTQPLTCNQAIANFELQYKSTYATCMDSKTDAWRQSQGASVVTCVGASQGINSPEQFYASPQAQCQTALTYQNVATTAPASVLSSVPAGSVPAAPPTLGDGTASPVASGAAGTSTSSALAVVPTEPAPTSSSNASLPAVNNTLIPSEPVVLSVSEGSPGSVSSSSTPQEVVQLNGGSIPIEYQ